MKINPNDKVLQGAVVPGLSPKKDPISTSFADILSKTAQPATAKQVMASPMIQPMIITPPASQHEVYERAERMLDSMAKYQGLLGDPKINLREIAPTVAQLKEEAFSLEPMLKGMDEKDPVAQIAREAMIIANKEIVRFEAGGYVEEV
jgi:hypothetical protein